MAKRSKPTATPQATLHPLERIQAAQTKLAEIENEIGDIVRDIEPANIALVAGSALSRLDMESRAEPLPASEQIDKVLNALSQVEDLAKLRCKETREAGKLAEHLMYAVRSLYREVLARGDSERARLREREAERQQSMFPAEDRN